MLKKKSANFVAKFYFLTPIIVFITPMQRIYRHTILLLTLLFCATSSIVAQDARKQFTLVIDAGHGGHDPGAVGKFAQEKHINLNVALGFGNLVKANCPDVKVVYTRSNDVFIPLQERANIANRNKADLFVSIHTNAAAKGSSANGTETYTLGMARANENLEVAKRENAVITLEKDYKQTYEDFDPNSPESYIIFELMQDKNMEQSVELARLVQSQFKNHAGRRTRGTGVYQAGFLVLRKTSAPSILTELGFISHPGEEAFLASEEGVNAMSQSLYNAFIKYRKAQNVAYQAPAPVVKEVKPEPQRPDLSAQSVAPNSQTPSVRPVDTTPKHEQNNASNATSVEQKTVENAVATTCDNATAASATPAVDPARPVFKLQITVMSKKISTDDPIFRDLEGVECYEDGGVFKYTCYPSNDFDTVRQKQARVKEMFPQVFVVAFIDGKRADLYQAKQQALKKK